MAGLRMPMKGGARGGRDQFKWDDVKAEKYRENYLGHSLMAPVGRWQMGRDLQWYSKDKGKKSVEDAMPDHIRSEMESIKQREREALAQALGFQGVTYHAPIGQSKLSSIDMEETFKRGELEADVPTITGTGMAKLMGAVKAPKGMIQFEGQESERRPASAGAVAVATKPPADAAGKSAALAAPAIGAAPQPRDARAAMDDGDGDEGRKHKKAKKHKHEKSTSKRHDSPDHHHHHHHKSSHERHGDEQDGDDRKRKSSREHDHRSHDHKRARAEP